MTIHFAAALKEQWQRVIMGISGRPEIDNLTAMYRIELQELHSAEQQLSALVDEIGSIVRFAPLAGQLSEYATALRMSKTEISKRLTGVGLSSRTRHDGVMRALVEKTCRTAEQSTSSVRDVALMAALQHIVHYMITDYTTLASHASALGHNDEAARFASHAKLNQELDCKLSRLTESKLSFKATEPCG
jgi:ferritin-like metal-binding protein YciE